MLSLAGAVLLLRAGGHAVGWGFQFQEPLFVAVLSGVVLLFALNLLGVFELGVPAHGAGSLLTAVDHTHGVRSTLRDVAPGNKLRAAIAS